MFAACLLAVTQAPKKDGIVWVFDENNNGLFPAPNFGRHGLKHWQFKEIFAHLEYAELPPGVSEDNQMDSYWQTDQLIHRFNEHYHKNFDHGWKVICNTVNTTF
eukprot:94625-Ditylum_brightwellii.AAC.1